MRITVQVIGLRLLHDEGLEMIAIWLVYKHFIFFLEPHWLILVLADVCF